MKKNFRFPALLFVLTLAACQKEMPTQSDNTGNDMDASAPKGEGAPSGNNAVSLYVIIEDYMSDNTSTSIRTDLYENGSPKRYEDGIQKVEAQILSSDGNFYMQSNNNTKTGPLRTIRFPFNTSLEDKHQYRLRTRNGGVWLQNMDAAGSEAIMSFRIWGNRPKGVLDWNLVYDELNAANTVNVKVTRTGDSWTIESLPPSNARLTDGNGNPLPAETNGVQPVPIKLTLIKKG